MKVALAPCTDVLKSELRLAWAMGRMLLSVAYANIRISNLIRRNYLCASFAGRPQRFCFHEKKMRINLLHLIPQSLANSWSSFHNASSFVTEVVGMPLVVFSLFSCCRNISTDGLAYDFLVVFISACPRTTAIVSIGTPSLYQPEARVLRSICG